MNDEYITGHISVLIAGLKKENVYLDFNVQGRVATINLGNGDLIELIDQEPAVTVTTDEILDSFENKDLDESYQGRKVRVKLNPGTTKQIREKARDYAITELFKGIESKKLKASEAAELYERIYKIQQGDVLE